MRLIKCWDDIMNTSNDSATWLRFRNGSWITTPEEAEDSSVRGRRAGYQAYANAFNCLADGSWDDCASHVASPVSSQTTGSRSLGGLPADLPLSGIASSSTPISQAYKYEELPYEPHFAAVQDSSNPLRERVEVLEERVDALTKMIKRLLEDPRLSPQIAAEGLEAILDFRPRG